MNLILIKFTIPSACFVTCPCDSMAVSILPNND